MRRLYGSEAFMDSLAMRGLWLAVGLLFSLVTAIAGGVLAHLSGVHPATAVLSGAGAFAGTVTLFVLVANFLR